VRWSGSVSGAINYTFNGESQNGGTMAGQSSWNFSSSTGGGASTFTRQP
jgi:hypothetical protein